MNGILYSNQHEYLYNKGDTTRRIQPFSNSSTRWKLYDEQQPLYGLSWRMKKVFVDFVSKPLILQLSLLPLRHFHFRRSGDAASLMLVRRPNCASASAVEDEAVSRRIQDALNNSINRFSSGTEGRLLRGRSLRARPHAWVKRGRVEAVIPEKAATTGEWSDMLTHHPITRYILGEAK